MPQLVHTVHARLDGIIARETAAGVAFLVGDATVWLPKSQLYSLVYYPRNTRSEDVRVGKRVRSVEIPDWLAREKGLEKLEDGA